MPVLSRSRGGARSELERERERERDREREREREREPSHTLALSLFPNVCCISAMMLHFTLSCSTMCLVGSHVSLSIFDLSRLTFTFLLFRAS